MESPGAFRSPLPERAFGRPQRWHGRARHALRRSLRLRLVLVFLLMALVMTAIFLVGTQRALSQGWRQALQPLLADYVDRLVNDLGSPPSVTKAEALVARLPISIRIDGPVVHWSSRGQAADEARESRGRWHDDGPGLLERMTADGHRVVLGLGDLPWRSEPRLMGWFTLGLLLVTTWATYRYVRYLLRPLDDIRAGAQRFGGGAFDTPIAVRRRDELGDLATQINTMARDIHQMLEGKRAMLLAISHELRSPLTRARLNVELLPEGGDTHAPRQALLRDLAEMRDLITDLLEGERLSGSHVALQRERLDVSALVRDLVASRSDFAQVELALPLHGPLAMLDAARVRLALRNLLDNALRHGAHAANRPRLSILVEGTSLTLGVRDHGPGVDEAQLPHLAQAFYRPDTARQRSTGGVGLGLFLARLVAQAHGGKLVLRNAHPGLEACVVLPLELV